MKSSITARFSAAASTYHQHANIQRRVAKELMTLLPAFPTPSRILEIGCGTGVLTAMLARFSPSAKIDAVDISPAMITQARNKLSGNKRIKWIVADARGLAGRKKYPLIISSCALHWITPLSSILKKLARGLERDGRLAFAIMTRGTLAELRESRNRIAPHKPPRIILPTESKVRQAIARAGLTIMTGKSEVIRREYSSVKKIIRQLHEQGLTGGNIRRNKTILTRSEISRLIADYAKKYRAGRGIYATYRVFYGMAMKEM